METPYFFVLFERGRRGADGAAASAFGFPEPEGAAGSSFFYCKNKTKKNGENDGLGKSAVAQLE